ncbi:NYN domain-containing protein [Thermosynechococcus sp.]|uniref:NYN domain-containing protein n=1 Tax=Thermosynechococcus sp. TaxID=2814275 RepID=UPI003919CDB0
MAGALAVALTREPLPVVAVSSAGALVGSWVQDRQRHSLTPQIEDLLQRLEERLEHLETRTLGNSQRRTAIFYDIENLIKGYNIRAADMAKISLGAIQAHIRQAYPIERVLLQRAYANWSDARLASLRREMHQLGIEPVQVFGFSYENRKNAADIQLAIDVVDLIFQDDRFDTFVIVSGDGGFGSLAKKLRQYGKTVIGCAYEDAAGKSFQAICDAFVHIPDPTVKPRPPVVSSAPLLETPTPSAIPLDPDNRRLCADLSVSLARHAEGAIAKTREILDWYRRDSACGKLLREEGLVISKVQGAVHALLPNFDILQLGMVKFSEYLRYACKNTIFCIFHPQGSANQLRLGLREHLPPSAVVMANFEKRPLHSLATYRALLSHERVAIAQPTVLAHVLAWLLEHRDRAATLGELATMIEKTTPTEISRSQIEIALNNCQTANILVLAPHSSDRYFVAEKITTAPEGYTALVQWLDQTLQVFFERVGTHPKPELLRALVEPSVSVSK